MAEQPKSTAYADVLPRDEDCEWGECKATARYDIYAHNVEPLRWTPYCRRHALARLRALDRRQRPTGQGVGEGGL